MGAGVERHAVGSDGMGGAELARVRSGNGVVSVDIYHAQGETLAVALLSLTVIACIKRIVALPSRLKLLRHRL